MALHYNQFGGENFFSPFFSSFHERVFLKQICEIHVIFVFYFQEISFAGMPYCPKTSAKKFHSLYLPDKSFFETVA
jgi:hypothetical protein